MRYCVIKKKIPKNITPARSPRFSHFAPPKPPISQKVMLLIASLFFVVKTINEEKAEKIVLMAIPAISNFAELALPFMLAAFITIKAVPKAEKHAHKPT